MCSVEERTKFRIDSTTAQDTSRREWETPCAHAIPSTNEVVFDGFWLETRAAGKNAKHVRSHSGFSRVTSGAVRCERVRALCPLVGADAEFFD